MFELKKIGIVKRASALLLDAILLAVLATGFMWIVSLICNFEGAQETYRGYRAEWETFETSYFLDVAGFYGYDCTENGEGGYTITKNGAPATQDDILTDLFHSKGGDAETKAAYDAYLKLPSSGQVHGQYVYLSTMLFMMLSVGLLLAYLVLEFLLPLVFKNGQTVGKKVFGIGLVRPDCVKIPTSSLFARMLIGKFAIETMFPILLVFLFFLGVLGWLAIALLAALLILNVVLFFATRNRTFIHDILAVTVAVDIKTQMIYGSVEELNERKSLAHKEFVENSKERD